MVYASGIRLPCVPHLYKSSAPSGFNGDRRSTSLSVLLKKDSFSRTYSHIYLLPIEAFAFIFLFGLLNEFIFTLFFSPSFPDNMNLVILSMYETVFAMSVMNCESRICTVRVTVW